MYNVPATEGEFNAFSLANADHHRRIVEAVQRAGGFLTLYNLDPLPLFDARRWFLRHQQAHNDMNALAGTAGFDLSILDITDRPQVQAWIRLHAQEHLNVAEVLGIF